jgi:hypothetical protein
MKPSYKERFMQYHNEDVWGKFLVWLQKLNERKKKNGKRKTT